MCGLEQHNGGLRSGRSTQTAEQQGTPQELSGQIWRKMTSNRAGEKREKPDREVLSTSWTPRRPVGSFLLFSCPHLPSWCSGPYHLTPSARGGETEKQWAVCRSISSYATPSPCFKMLSAQGGPLQQPQKTTNQLIILVFFRNGLKNQGIQNADVPMSWP